MKENVLDVLMYLFENYYMDEEDEVRPDQEYLRVELRKAGFPNAEIQKAFEWLEALAAHRDVSPPVVQKDHSLRLFSEVFERLREHKTMRHFRTSYLLQGSCAAASVGKTMRTKCAWWLSYSAAIVD